MEFLKSRFACTENFGGKLPSRQNQDFCSFFGGNENNVKCFWPLACYFCLIHTLIRLSVRVKNDPFIHFFWCFVSSFSKMFQYNFLFHWPHYFRGDWTLNRFWIQGWKVVLDSIATTWEPKLHEKLANWFLKAFWQPSCRALSKSC